MLCPHCLSDETKVPKTIKDEKTIRVRKCSECDYVFITQELHKCTVCESNRSKVTSTMKDIKVKRFRTCLSCTNKYTTYEAVFVDEQWNYYVELYS